MVQPFWKTTWQFLTELNVDLLYDPLTLILGTKFIFNHKMKTYFQKKSLCMNVTWFKVSKNGNKTNFLKPVNGFKKMCTPIRSATTQ